MEKSHVEILAGEIQANGLAAINDLIVRKEAENFFLEFKRTAISDYSGKRKLEQSDYKNLGKAISGFGNSEGGILIWGIDAPSNHGEGDYAKDIFPIIGVENFASLLESYVRLSTVPAHSSVRSFFISCPESANSGIAITVIPKSNDRPHQYIVDGQNNYYIRAGDSFIAAPHGVIQGMFGKAPQSDVALMYITQTPKILSTNEIHLRLGLMAMNGGTGIATDINGYIRMWTPGDNSQIAFEIVDHVNYTYQSAFGVETSFISKPNFRLGFHQRSQMIVLDFKLKPPFTQNLEAQLCIGASNQRSYQKEVIKTPEELQKIYDHYITLENFDNFYEEFWDSPLIAD